MVKTKQGTQFLAFTKNNSIAPGSGTDYRDEASSEEDYIDYIDYSNEEDEWLDKCSFVKNSGKMKQKDIPSQGGSIHIKCSGGCINIHKVIFIFPKKIFPFCTNDLKVLYACWEDPPNLHQLKVVQKLCQGKEECKVKFPN